MTLTIGELFAGIGGFSLAFEVAGFRTAWFVENEPYCQKVLAKNFPGTPIYGDIHDCRDLPYVDVITAGFPCQPFSVAGKGLGRDDERFLVPEMLRVISEVKPSVVLFENVPNFTSLTDGCEFRELLRTLAEMGYDAQWGRLRASDVGAPHPRERWFCVAYAAESRLSARQPHGHGQDAAQARAGLVEQSQRHGADVAYGDGRRHSRSPTTDRRQTAHYQRRDAQTRHGLQVTAVRRSERASQRSGHIRNARPTQPCLGRNFDGLPNRLDEHPGWPAGQGSFQYPFEPPRTTTDMQHRADRVKALGNAVVPQVVYPIALEIRKWLEA